MRLRHLAPAGAPIRARDLGRWGLDLLAGGDPRASLEAAIRERFDVPHCVLTRTGRAGLALLLRAFHQLRPDRDEVVLPAYTCFSVPASVVRAGLRVRLVDVDPETLDIDARQLANVDFGRVLAVVATNLYGLPNDLPALTALAAQHGVFVVDDAAQAMGASVGGRLSGTWGDAGLFSLDKGKNVTAIDAGVLVTRSDRVAGALADVMRGSADPGLLARGEDLLKVLAYAALLHPRAYAIPNSMPGLGLGLTRFTTDIPLEGCNPWLAALGRRMLPRLDAFTTHRRAIAARLAESLTGVAGLSLPRPVGGSAPGYLRLPLLVADAGRRDHLLETLNERGVGATGSYPTSLADVAELQPHVVNRSARVDGSRWVAARMVTLPTHPYVTPADVDRMVGAIREEVGTVESESRPGVIRPREGDAA